MIGISNINKYDKNIEDHYDCQNINDHQLDISEVASKSKNYCYFPFVK